MIESIGSVKNDLSALIDNLVKKIETKVVSNNDIEDLHEEAKPIEKYQTYNKKGEVAANHVVLLERYSKEIISAYIYYKGERTSYLDLLQKAVDTGAIELDENESVMDNYERAWKVLIEDKAKPLYGWSKSLYSEDGMYKFRVENGEITGMHLARTGDGVLHSDIIEKIANGIKPCDLGDGIFDVAHSDPELYQVACSIGSARRMYEESDNKSLFDILFGFSVKDNVQNFVQLALENFNQTRYNHWFETTSFALERS